MNSMIGHDVSWLTTGKPLFTVTVRPVGSGAMREWLDFVDSCDEEDGPNAAKRSRRDESESETEDLKRSFAQRNLPQGLLIE